MLLSPLNKKEFVVFLVATLLLMVGLISCDPHLPQRDVQGHRGARAVWPENSLQAFVFAAEVGATTLELDVVVTAEGAVVVSHEPWLNPTICSGPEGESLGPESRVSLYTMPLATLQRCDCGSLGNPRFPRQQRVPAFKPTLQQVVDAVNGCRRPSVRYNIEVKHAQDWVGVYAPEAEVAVERVLAAVAAAGIAERTTLQSFSAAVLERVHAAAAGVRTAWLMEEERGVEEALALLSFKPDIYSPHHVLLSPEEVERAHALGVQVVPWTVNEAERMAELWTWGVDGVISDDPELALEVAAQTPLPTLDAGISY